MVQTLFVGGTMTRIQLSDAELNQKLKSIAADERKMTMIAIEHIAEVDLRKLYLKLGFSSMYEYLRTEIGYSEGCAQRRIDAARLAQNNPELGEKIKCGSVNLSQISKAQQVFRQVKKETKRAVPLSLQKQILAKIENKSVRETEQILAQEFNIKIETNERTKVQRDESVRIELIFDKEEMAIIKKAQELLSNKTGGKLKDTLLEMAKKTIKSYEQKTPTTTAVAMKLTGQRPLKINSVPRVTKSITPRVRRDVLARDQHCQFKDHSTGKTCGSRVYLEIDHITPRFAGGKNDLDNLRVLCRIHNQYRYTSRT